MSAIILENRQIRVGVDPALGATIQEITTRSDGDDWIFWDPDRRPSGSLEGRTYDDVWAGGFEELFPNDAPGAFDGRVLPDHGELWRARFEILERTTTSIRLRHVCTTVPVVIEKTVRLAGNQPAFTITYQLRNTGSSPVYYLFKLHAAMRLESGDRLLLPGGTVTSVDAAFSSIVGSGEHTWPWVTGSKGPVDLSVVQGVEAGLREFVYVSDLPESWCGLRRTRTGRAIMFRYPSDVFRYCWLFVTYGGWRGYHTVVLEPCSNMPKDLARARAAGACAVLEPHDVQSFAITVDVDGLREQ